MVKSKEYAAEYRNKNRDKARSWARAYYHRHKHECRARNKLTLQYRMDKNTESRRLKKQQAAQYLGGKCEVCGYNKCISALEFHHKNGDEKDVSISALTNRTWNKLQKELDKCQLLCANCHRELHAASRCNSYHTYCLEGV